MNHPGAHLGLNAVAVLRGALRQRLRRQALGGRHLRGRLFDGVHFVVRGRGAAHVLAWHVIALEGLGVASDHIAHTGAVRILSGADDFTIRVCAVKEAARDEVAAPATSTRNGSSDKTSSSSTSTTAPSCAPSVHHTIGGAARRLIVSGGDNRAHRLPRARETHVLEAARSSRRHSTRSTTAPSWIGRSRPSEHPRQRRRGSARCRDCVSRPGLVNIIGMVLRDAHIMRGARAHSSTQQPPAFPASAFTSTAFGIGGASSAEATAAAGAPLPCGCALRKPQSVT